MYGTNLLQPVSGSCVMGIRTVALWLCVCGLCREWCPTTTWWDICMPVRRWVTPPRSAPTRLERSRPIVWLSYAAISAVTFPSHHRQGRSQEFSKGDKPGGLGTEDLHRRNRNCRSVLLLWPWPWPDDLHIRTWPVYHRDTPDVRKWTSYVKDFESYHLTDRQTERRTDIQTDRQTDRTEINHVSSRLSLIEQSEILQNCAELAEVVFIYIFAFLPRCMECRRGLAMRILSVRSSVCPSVKRVHCDKNKKNVTRFLYHTTDHLA